MDNNYFDKKPIGVIDSGVGGLTSIKELKKELPNENFIYIGDTKRMPYGEKNTEDIIKYTLEMSDFLTEKYDIKTLLIACNTATVRALDIAKERYDFPVIGVVNSAARKVSDLTKTNHIGILATNSTVQSNKYPEQIKEINNDINVKQVASARLVEMIENDDFTSKSAQEEISNIVKPFNIGDIDSLVLACTHFAIAGKYIKQSLDNIEIVDSGKEAVKTLKNMLIEKELKNKTSDNNLRMFFTTGDVNTFKKVASSWLEEDIKINYLNITNNGLKV